MREACWGGRYRAGVPGADETSFFCREITCVSIFPFGFAAPVLATKSSDPCGNREREKKPNAPVSRYRSCGFSLPRRETPKGRQMPSCVEVNAARNRSGAGEKAGLPEAFAAMHRGREMNARGVLGRQIRDRPPPGELMRRIHLLPLRNNFRIQFLLSSHGACSSTQKFRSPRKPRT